MPGRGECAVRIGRAVWNGENPDENGEGVGFCSADALKSGEGYPFGWLDDMMGREAMWSRLLRCDEVGAVMREGLGNA